MEILGLLTIFLGAAVLFVVAVVSLSLIRGFVLAKLWLWFLVPLGLPVLSIPAAIGVAMTVAMITHQSENVKDERTGKEKGVAFAMAFVGPFITLLFGYVVKGYL